MKKKFINLMLISIAAIGFFSCSTISKIESSRDYQVDKKSIKDSSTVVLINYTNKKLFMGDNSTITIKCNDEILGALKIDNYVTIKLLTGKNKLMLEHKDVWYFFSKHSLKLQPGKNYYLLRAKPFGHKVEKVDKIPMSPDRELKEQNVIKL